MQIRIIHILLILYCSSSVISMKLSPCARWNTTGVMVAGTGELGNSNRQLYHPKGIFILKRTNELYVADFGNNRTQMFSVDKLPNSGLGITVASTKSEPENIYVDDDDDGPTIYITFSSNKRVEKWVKGASSGKQVGEECLHCTGVSVDQDKNVYLADTFRHCVIKWFPQTNTTTVIAGIKGHLGLMNNRLAFPRGIYLSRNTSSLYVADSANARIQKWLKDAEEGVTVAETNLGNGTNSVGIVNAVSVLVDDETDVIYVVEQMENRISRWIPGASNGDTIAGGKGLGNAADQLHMPYDLAFDNENNLYVSDFVNHCVQFFALIENKPCLETSTIPSGTTTTMKNNAVLMQRNRHFNATLIIAILSIVLWLNR